jgi:hypothetical protein
MPVAPNELDGITTDEFEVCGFGIGWNYNLVWIAESFWTEQGVNILALVPYG